MGDHGWVARRAGTAPETAERTAYATARDTETAYATTGDTETADEATRNTETTEYAARFPGCRPVRLLTDRLPDFDGRLEYWDARTETAWVVAEPTGGIHEGTSRRLIHLAERIALVRGTPIASFGSVDLLVRDARGAPERMMQADETLYLHPGRARLPEGSLVIGEHDLPDVVLEVDHTTDVRPGKLSLYESWGFPELWVVVPPPAERRRRPAGVTIHRLDERAVPFRGGEPRLPRLDGGRDPHGPDRAGDDHAYTWRALERVGRTLGAREGTGPDDTPLLRSLGEQARAEGQTAGRAEELAAIVQQHAPPARDSGVGPVSGHGGRARRCSARRAHGRGARVRGRAGLPAPRRLAGLMPAVTPVRRRCG